MPAAGAATYMPATSEIASAPYATTSRSDPGSAASTTERAYSIGTTSAATACLNAGCPLSRSATCGESA